MNSSILSTINARRFITAFISRRGLLAAASGGLLTLHRLVDASMVGEARKRRHKKKRPHKRKKGNGQARVDALCPGPTDNTGFSFEDAQIAQTFTALRSGRLERAELLLDGGETGSADLTLELRDIDASGVPTATVFAESVVLSSDVPTGENTVVFTFTNAPSVVASREYALVISQRGPRSVSWKGHRDDSCDGRAFRSEPSGVPFEAQVADLDLIFTTVVRS